MQSRQNPTDLFCTSDGVDEGAKRDPESIKNRSLAAVVLGYEQFDGAFGETSEISQAQAIDAQ
jgi:hypothetical protein